MEDRQHKRAYQPYQAHLLRRDVVHASEDEMVVLLGELSLEPETDAAYAVEYPLQMQGTPRVTVRFLSERGFARFIEDCKEGELDVPPGFGDLPSPKVEETATRLRVQLEDNRPGRLIPRWLAWLGTDDEAPLREGVEIGRLELRFRTEREPGAYLFLVEWEHAPTGGARRFRSVVHTRPKTSFPDQVDDLADIVAAGVNLDPKKHGIIWFVHPIYFAEQILRVSLSDAVKDEMVNCEDLPDDLPAGDDVLTRLQWGRSHIGLRKICLSVDALVDEDCLDTTVIQVADRTVAFKDLVGRAG